MKMDIRILAIVSRQHTKEISKGDVVNNEKGEKIDDAETHIMVLFLRKVLLGNLQMMTMADLIASKNSLGTLQVGINQKHIESWRVSLLACTSSQVKMENFSSIQIICPCKLANENQSFKVDLCTLKASELKNEPKQQTSHENYSLYHEARCSTSLATKRQTRTIPESVLVFLCYLLTSSNDP